MDLGLTSKVVVITGGASGMGKEYCYEYAKEGADVAIIDININDAQQVADDINNRGGKAEAFYADITDHKEIKMVISTITERFGAVDILINNASARLIGQVDKIPVEDWDKQISIALTSVYNCTQPVVEEMKAKKYGKIINIASMSAIRGNLAGASHYAAAKAGVIGFTRSCAAELASFGINVNCIAPSSVNTPFTDSLPKEVLEKYRNANPMNRIAEPEDLVGMILLLSSDKSSFITGQTIYINGGEYMG
jgi:NAD(P)-dependent dehydrogenase (short-subunit alcohol dehydrogenase family)